MPARNVKLTASVLATHVAYTDWLARKGRASPGAERHSHQQFVQCIRQQLRTVGDDANGDLGLPGSTSSWSEWGKGQRSPTKLLRREVCEAVLAVTGHDITEKKLLSRNAHNFTDVAIISDLSLKRVSNQQTDSKEIYEVTLGYLQFRQSGTIEVTREWTKGISPFKSNSERIGTVKWAVRESCLNLISSGQKDNMLRAISPGSEPHGSEVVGLRVIEDHSEKGKWIVQSTSLHGELHGVCTNLLLGFAEEYPGEEIQLTISATPSDIVYSFRFDDAEEVGVIARQRAKEQLVSRILSIRNDAGSDDQRVLCRGKLLADGEV